MKKFEIPKEIKAKPRLLGLEMKEFAFVLVIGLFSLTVFSDTIHKIFVIPFYIVVALSLIYLFSSSRHNPGKKNYHSILYFLRRDRGRYYSLDKNKYDNVSILNKVREANKKQTGGRDKDKQRLDEHRKIAFIDGRFQFIDENKQDSICQQESEEDEELNKTTVCAEINEGEKQEESYSDITSSDDNQQNVKKSENKKKNDSERQRNVISLNRKKQQKDKREIGGGPMDENPSSSSLKEKLGDKKYMKYIYVSIIPFLLVTFILLNPFGWKVQFVNSDTSKAEENTEEDDEVLVSALRSFSLKDYDKAITLFDNIDYDSLDDDDKDVMLLTYLFGNQPEKALKLEPNFDETVVSYYKATHSMEKIRELNDNDEIDSKVIEFEVAVDDADYETIVDLKDFVKIKDGRDEVIVNAMMKVDDIKGAKDIAMESDNDELLDEVKKHEKKTKKKEKKNKNKGKKKGKKNDKKKNNKKGD